MAISSEIAKYLVNKYNFFIYINAYSFGEND